MNHWPVKIVLSMCFTFCDAIECNYGWVPAGKMCYKIFTKPVTNGNANVCKTYATQFPDGLKDNFGYAEKVWIKENRQTKAIDLTSKAISVPKNRFAKYYSLCEEPQIKNANLELHRNVRFHDGNWIIPNSNLTIEEMKEFIRKNSPLDMVWVGIFNNDSFYWTDGLQLSHNHKILLNISHLKTVTKGQCGVYSSQWKFSFRNCSECLNGLGMSNASAVKTTTCPSKTTEEEQSTQVTSIQTTELATVTEELSTTGSSTHSSPPDRNTVSHLTSQQSTDDTASHLTSQQSTNNIVSHLTSQQSTNDTVSYLTSQQSTNDTVSHLTSQQSTDDTVSHLTSQQSTTSEPCFCACNKILTRAEFMESIKDIKIKKTEASKYKRSKISAPDERTSSRAIGLIAASIMVIPFGLIILADLPLIIQPLRMYFRHMKTPENASRAVP